MSLSPRFTLAVLATVALSLASAAGHGFYTTGALLGAVVALVAALTACTRRTDEPVCVPAFLGPAVLLGAALVVAAHCLVKDWHRDWARAFLLPGVLLLAGRAALGRRRPFSPALTLLAAAALILAGRAVLYTELLQTETTPALLVLQGAALVGFLLLATFVSLDLGAPGGHARAFRPRLVLLFVAGAVLRAAAVAATPQPSIDVYDWLREAPRALLDGRNPYAVDYHLGHGTLPAYPPLPIVLAVPFSAGGLDVRYANVVCDLLAALAVWLAARRRGQPLLGALAAGAYLNLPGVPFMLKNAWYEPMLAAALGGGLLLAERGCLAGHFLLGLGLTGKQFGLPMFAPLWRAQRGQRLALLAGTGVAAALVVLPFFLWGPGDFVRVVLTAHLAVGPDLQALTARSAAYHLLGVTLPNGGTLAATLLLTGWLTWRTPARGAGAALWMGAALLVFCLFYVKGYFNYFYLCNYLFLLGAAALPTGGEAAAAPPVPPPREPLPHAA